jgi:Predicted SAM-dependent methyltransferase
MEFIFTCQKNNSKLPVYEFGLYDESFEFLSWLDEETGLARTALSAEELRAVVCDCPVIFVRHMFRADLTVSAADDYVQTIADMCAARLNVTDTFSVQLRSAAFAEPCVDVKGLASQIADKLVSDGYELDIKNGAQAVSVFVGTDKIYAGADYVENNLSKWKGGMPRFAQSDDFDFVSRSEYKLVDVLDSLSDDAISHCKTALDLGAAPGGWTKVLTDRGIKTVSVDPNKLDEGLRKHKYVKYYPMRAEQYIKINNGDTFDIIVNDMKMDAEKSIDLMMKFRGRLSDGGVIILTFKLPHVFSYKSILKNIDFIKSKGFEIIRARQFFHNRSEITVAARKLSAE